MMLRFAAPNPRRLKRLGVQGDRVEVSLLADALLLDQVRIDFAQLERIRIGFTESKSGTYLHTRLWLTGQPKPLELSGVLDRRGYAHLIHALAGILLARHPGVTVETGDGWFVPSFIFTTFGGMILASLVGTIWLYLAGDDWTIFLGALAVFVVLLGVLGPWVLSRYRPRRITRQSEVLRGLFGFRETDFRQESA